MGMEVVCYPLAGMSIHEAAEGAIRVKQCLPEDRVTLHFNDVAISIGHNTIPADVVEAYDATVTNQRRTVPQPDIGEVKVIYSVDVEQAVEEAFRKIMSRMFE